jgi:hypothetical protein
MVKGGDAFDTMLKNNQEQSTIGHVLCRHCGAVLFCKKDSPLQGNLELSAKVSHSVQNLKNFGSELLAIPCQSNRQRTLCREKNASMTMLVQALWRTVFKHFREHQLLPSLNNM